MADTSRLFEVYQNETLKREIAVRPDKTSTISLVRGRPVTVLQLPDSFAFHADSPVVLPVSPGGDGLNALLVVAAALEAFGSRVGHRLLVAGHAPGDADESLTQRRAQAALALLLGDRAGWGDVCAASYQVQDAQRALQWIAAKRGWACDPGPVDDAPGPKTRGGYAGFRKAYNQAHGGALAEGQDDLTAADWAAILDCYDEELRALLEADPARLAELRRLAGGGASSAPSPAPAPGPAPAPSPPPRPASPDPYLRQGSEGSQVVELQEALNRNGAGLTVDGDFGPATDAAVRDFQGREGLTVDGIVGPLTWEALFPPPPPPEPAPAPAATAPSQAEGDAGARAVGCGECWPRDKVRIKKHTVSDDGRIDFLLFKEKDYPQLKCHDVSPCNWKKCDLYRKNKYLVDELTAGRGGVPGPRDLPFGKHRALVLPAACFAYDSTFPTPGVAIYLRGVFEASEELPDARLVVFGHTDPVGSDQFNKNLSDRRARVILAMLTEDQAALDAIAAEDEWGIKEFQAMLRGLGCNPGKIDGETGALTEAATRAFQEEYNLGFFHRSPEAERKHPDLVVNGELDGPTRAALLDAYLTEYTVSIEPERFVGPRFAGCSEFNPLHDNDAENRRVTVGVIEGPTPEDSAFPCVEGNAQACTLDGGDPKMRCTFYREHFVEDERADDEAITFYDFRWLKEEDGRAHMSALTNHPDTKSVVFRVFRVDANAIPHPPPDSSLGEPVPDLGEEVAQIEGEIALGVAFARWEPPEDYDPFDLQDWVDDLGLVMEDPDDRGFLEFDDEEPDEDLEDIADPEQEVRALTSEDLLHPARLQEAVRVRPPLFRIDVEEGTHWGLSNPPGQRLRYLELDDQEEHRGMALRSDGALVPFVVQDGRINIADTVDVVSVMVGDGALKPAGGPGGLS